VEERWVTVEDDAEPNFTVEDEVKYDPKMATVLALAPPAAMRPETTGL
jgi:hypothetical protein